MPTQNSELDKYLKRGRFADDRRPSLEELDRAIENPDEADPSVVAFLRARPELVDLIRRVKEGLTES